MEYRGNSRSFTNRRQQHGHGGGQRNPTPSSHTTHALSFRNNIKTLLYVGKLGTLRFETLSSIIGRFLSSSLAFLFFPLASASRSSKFRRLLKQFDRKFFVVRRIHALIIALIFFKLFLSLIRRIGSRKKREKEKCLKAVLSSAVDYETWADAAAKLDCLEGKCLPRWVITRGTFGLSERAASLRQARESGDIASIAYTLRQDSTRRIGSLMATGAEESKYHILLPPPIVDDYIKEVKDSLHFICTDDTLSYDEKLSFTGELRHAYGRTGLVLSGGGSFGFFHFGVIRALFDAGLLPRVISGSSAGSIGAALLCTRSDAELKDYLDSFVDIGSLDFYGAPKSFFGYLRHLATKGALHTAEEYIERLKRLLGVETTFSEAFARSGRVLNVAVVAADTREPSRLLNYLTAPNVIIWSAVACSSAFPMLFEPQNLLCKDSSGRIVQLHASDATGLSGKMRRWCDGSLEEDLPMRGLSEMFSVNFFLCSQTNPWLVPILNAQSYLSPWMRRTIEFEVKHRLHQLLHVWRNSRVLKLLAQPWRGDLNFVLPANLYVKFYFYMHLQNIRQIICLLMLFCGKGSDT